MKTHVSELLKDGKILYILPCLLVFACVCVNTTYSKSTNKALKHYFEDNPNLEQGCQS